MCRVLLFVIDLVVVFYYMYIAITEKLPCRSRSGAFENCELAFLSQLQSVSAWIPTREAGWDWGMVSRVSYVQRLA